MQFNPLDFSGIDGLEESNFMDASNANIKTAFDGRQQYLPDGTQVVNNPIASNQANQNNQQSLPQPPEEQKMIGLGDLNLPQDQQNAGLGDLGAALANMSCISIGGMDEKDQIVDQPKDSIFSAQQQQSLK